MPLTWKPYKRAQKDVDARWTKKHGKSHFGYKLHASVVPQTPTSHGQWRCRCGGDGGERFLTSSPR